MSHKGNIWFPWETILAEVFSRFAVELFFNLWLFSMILAIVEPDLSNNDVSIMIKVLVYDHFQGIKQFSASQKVLVFFFHAKS